MSTLAPKIEAPPAAQPANASRRFQIEMACAGLVLIALATAGSYLASIRIEGAGTQVIAVLAVLAMMSPIPAYWHEKGRWALRDSALTIPWMLLFAVLLPFPFLVGARLRMPLQDALLAHIDRLLGVSVPGIMAWARHHGLNPALGTVYNLLVPLLLFTIFVPALAGKLRHAQEFLLANVIALGIGSVLFAALPAIGPWSYYHLTPDPIQSFCQSQLLALRHPGVYSFLWQAEGIVCFPSFHVVWAVLCAAALWGFRPLRDSGGAALRHDCPLHDDHGLALLYRCAGRFNTGRLVACAGNALPETQPRIGPAS